jgi:Mg2+ and Co2+ transporter CorA
MPVIFTCPAALAGWELLVAERRICRPGRAPCLRKDWRVCVAGLITTATSWRSPPVADCGARPGGQPFWLDIENPTDEVIDRLAARLGLHPLAVENSKQFGQQGKLQVYGNVAMIVPSGSTRSSATR